VTEAFLGFNSDRRQLDPLDETVVIIRRHAAERRRSLKQLTWDD